MLLKKKINFKDIEVERRRYNSGGTDVLLFALTIGIIGICVYVLFFIEM